MKRLGIEFRCRKLGAMNNREGQNYRIRSASPKLFLTSPVDVGRKSVVHEGRQPG